jgi:hypothetical protein
MREKHRDWLGALVLSLIALGLAIGVVAVR